jgi:hypothetical protein
MEEQKKVPHFNVIAAVLFGILGFIFIQNASDVWKYSTTRFNNVLWIITLVLIVVTLLVKKNYKLDVIAFALLALLTFYSFYRGFGLGRYKVDKLVNSYRYSYVYKFSIFCMLATFLQVLSTVFMFLLVLSKYVESLKNKFKMVWFMPGLCYLGSLILAILIKIILKGYWYGSVLYFGGNSVIRILLFAGGLVFAGLYYVYPNGIPKSQPVQGNGYNNTNGVTGNTSGYANNGTSNGFNTLPGEAYISLVTHILLLLITCGIWNLIWTYRVTGYLNCIEDEEQRNPVTKLLLCMFVPFYTIFWVYKSAQRIDKLAYRKGVSSEISTLCLILEIFVPIIPPILMQDKINSIVTAKEPVNQATVANGPAANGYASNGPASNGPVANGSFGNQGAVNQPVASQSARNEMETIEELKKYKELLDTGVITQEEYDAKKTQLLGV